MFHILLYYYYYIITVQNSKINRVLSYKKLAIAFLFYKFRLFLNCSKLEDKTTSLGKLFQILMALG